MKHPLVLMSAATRFRISYFKTGAYGGFSAIPSPWMERGRANSYGFDPIPVL